MSMSNKKRKCDSGNQGGADLDHPSITKLDGLVDKINKIKSRFNSHRGKIPNSLQKTLDDHLDTFIRSCENFMEDSNNAAGEWLHDTIHGKPDVADVRKVIDLFPDALVHENADGYIPIQTNFTKRIGWRYVPILAEEASKRGMGAERGGLLLPNPLTPSSNILQSLLLIYYKSHSENKDVESRNIRAMEALRNANLFIDEDFARFNLLGAASYKDAQKRLEYLINLYPASLSTPLPHGDYPIHISNHRIGNGCNYCHQVFANFLKHGMKYYPEKFGFLFERNARGEMPIQQAIAKFGKKQTLDIIQQAIPPSEDHPILHFVYRYTPSLVGDFVYRYPNAIRLKDRHGRHLLHIAVKRGLKLSPSLLMMIHCDKKCLKGRDLLHIAVKRGLKLSPSLLMMIHCDKKCLEEKDPVTNLYPFMLAATSGYAKDLTTIYNLLSYCPEVMSRCLDDEGGDTGMASE